MRIVGQESLQTSRKGDELEHDFLYFAVFDGGEVQTAC